MDISETSGFFLMPNISSNNDSINVFHLYLKMMKHDRLIDCERPSKLFLTCALSECMLLIFLFHGHTVISKKLS